jgi:hypothetical protein
MLEVLSDSLLCAGLSQTYKQHENGNLAFQISLAALSKKSNKI